MSSSQWVDANGTPWRFSTVTKSWQARVNGRWVNRALPSGGLQRTDLLAASPGVRIVETMGPPGASGPPGPPGTRVSVSEVLPAQYQDGVNAVFPLSVSADLGQVVQVYRNGLLETPGYSYLITPTHVTFTTPPLDSDVLTVVYQKAQ